MLDRPRLTLKYLAAFAGVGYVVGGHEFDVDARVADGADETCGNIGVERGAYSKIIRGKILQAVKVILLCPAVAALRRVIGGWCLNQIVTQHQRHIRLQPVKTDEAEWNFNPVIAALRHHARCTFGDANQHA